MGHPKRPERQFVMVPNWLLDLNPSGAALRVYCELARFGEVRGDWCESIHPSHKTVAKKAELSVPTVKRAVAELEKLGALTREHRRSADGDPDSNSYRLRVGVGSPMTRGGFISDPTPNEAKSDTPDLGGFTSEPRVGSPVTPGVGSLVSYNPEPSYPDPMTQKVADSLRSSGEEAEGTTTEEDTAPEDSTWKNQSHEPKPSRTPGYCLCDRPEANEIHLSAKERERLAAKKNAQEPKWLARSAA